jgi:hypothetical protein
MITMIFQKFILFQIIYFIYGFFLISPSLLILNCDGKNFNLRYYLVILDQNENFIN